MDECRLSMVEGEVPTNLIKFVTGYFDEIGNKMLLNKYNAN